jgi:large subunit ribosomal protein L24e
MKCSFCGIEIPPGTGLMYVQKDGKIFYFCGRKCEKNMLKLGRKPRKIKWTEEYHKLKKGAKK